MNKEKLDELLANGSITQEEYDKLIESLGLGEKETEEEEKKEPESALEDERIKRLIKSEVDKITSKLGKEKADLQKKLDKFKKEKLTEDEIKQDAFDEKEKALAERERALLEKESRLYAIKAIKAAGLDDGSDKALELVDFVLDDDTDVIDSKVKVFGNLVKKFAESEIDRKFKESGRNPNAGSKGKSAYNPYAKETFNLTEQMRLEAEEPEKAKALRAAAGLK